MRNKTLDKFSPTELFAFRQRYTSNTEAASALGVPRTTLRDRLFSTNKKATEKIAKIKFPSSKQGTVRFILSSAQRGAALHKPFWNNLTAYAKALDARILIGGYDYNSGDAVYPEELAQFLTYMRCDLGQKLLFCAEMNTLPTATHPLSGFEAYTRDKWGVFPHPRISLKSIPTLFHSQPKIIMTTGSVTKPNYFHKKAGIKAEFHHVIAAVIVEIDADGGVFCRHLVADKNGDFQDLDTIMRDGAVSPARARVEAITWGDIHTERLDPDVARGAFGIDFLTFDRNFLNGSMLDELMPKHQFIHDLTDFHRRNHHSIGDPHHRFKMYTGKTESVEEELRNCGAFLSSISRDWCNTVVVDSNHDRALNRWLKTADYKNDPVNAVFFLRTQLAVYEALERDDDEFNVFERAVRSAFVEPLFDVEFLRNTDSYLICEHAGGGIECALHGDQGANGAKGNINSFARMGPKANTADKHAAEIFEGIYQAGHSCRRDMIYNRGGLTSWSPSHIITYPSGKRTIVTMQGAKWRG